MVLRAIGKAAVAVLAPVIVLVAGCAVPDERREAAPEPTEPAQCAAATDPAGLACRINTGEATLGDPNATAEQRAAAGRAVHAAYRRLAATPEWDAPTLAAVTPALRDYVNHAVAAERELVSLAGPPQPTLPAWRIVGPQPPQELRAHYDEAQRRFGVRWSVLAAIHLIETRMGRVIGLSSAGAQGPMQFMPATWARYGLGGDVWNTRDAVLGAANYLAANGGNEAARLDRALWRYNNDVRYVRAVRHYAAMMDADPGAFLRLHAWPVTYRTTAGDIELPVGYAADRPLPVEQWLRDNGR